jgi:hypothetical protein
MLVGPVRQISLARYLDDPGANRNVAGERWTKIDIAQLEQADRGLGWRRQHQGSQTRADRHRSAHRTPSPRSRLAVGRPNPAGGEDICVTMPERIECVDDRCLLIADHSHFLEIDADRCQIFRDIAAVLVLGAASLALLRDRDSIAAPVGLTRLA